MSVKATPEPLMGCSTATLKRGGLTSWGRRRAGLASYGLAVSVVLLAGCSSVSPRTDMDCDAATKPAIETSKDGAFRTTTLSVLTYNIEGLGWPARRGRARRLREIGETLSAMNSSVEGPDVVMVQEMFSRAAKKAVAVSGYPAIATGPGRRTRSGEATAEALPGKAGVRRGELGLRLFGSGLAIASRYPIIDTETRAYGRKSCAGIDCLANKGVLLSRIIVPGVPAQIDLYNTHMNSRRASRAPVERHLAAHERQTLEASAFIDQTHLDRHPLIFGGDFNMRHSEDRWANFLKYQSLEFVHRVCAQPASACDVRESWDGDEPWMDTQDLQFFSVGDLVSIRPIRVEAMFDGANEPILSDHDGFMVTYELRWPADAAPTDCATPPTLELLTEP